MDTRFWGPSGWRFLHLISFTYEPTQKEYVKEMFEMLPYVLPCKFCRASLTEYYKKEKLEPALKNKETLSRWLYKIHNHVNDKLRKQLLLHEPNPPFTSVKKVYEERISAGCIRTDFEGWDFLFSIAENHPFSYSSRHSTPMPNMPISASKSKDPSVQNQWNILSPVDRMPFYKRFWIALGNSLPFQEWRDSWIECKPRIELVQQRKRWLRELWRICCCLENKLQLINREKFDSVCKRLYAHKSGCNKTRRAKTCRAKNITRKNKK